MRYPLRVPPYCNPKHADSHRPRSVPNRELNIPVVGSSVLSDHRVVHHCVGRVYYLAVAASLPQHSKETFEMLARQTIDVNGFLSQ